MLNVRKKLVLMLIVLSLTAPLAHSQATAPSTQPAAFGRSHSLNLQNGISPTDYAQAARQELTEDAPIHLRLP
jgi:hypothetical protein